MSLAQNCVCVCGGVYMLCYLFAKSSRKIESNLDKITNFKCWKKMWQWFSNNYLHFLVFFFLGQ